MKKHLSTKAAALFQNGKPGCGQALKKLSTPYQSIYGFPTPNKHSPYGNYFLTPVQLAELLQVCTKTLGRLREKGEGPPYFIISKKIRYAIVDVDDWITKSRKQQDSSESFKHNKDSQGV